MTGIEPVTSSLPRKRSTPELHRRNLGAEDGIRTRDPQLGRLTLYQLSYSRNFNKLSLVWIQYFKVDYLLSVGDPVRVTPNINFKPQPYKSELLTPTCIKFMWGEQDSNLRRRSQQIYSLPSLAA